MSEKGDEGGGVPGNNLPPTLMAADDECRGGLAGTDIENWPAGGHQAIGLAGDYRAKGGRFLGYETDVAGTEALDEFLAGPVSIE
jgi:hypothetical protein